MAYNILKDDVEFSGVNLGNIEDMINDHANQSVGGVKTFTSTVTASAGVSASVYYGNGANLSGISVTPGGVDRSIQFHTASALSGNANFIFDGSNVTLTGELSASFISGSGANIFNLSPSNISGVLNASKINLGQGLEDSSNAVRVKLDSTPGIARSNSGIKIDVDSLSSAGSLADADILLVDKSGNKKTTAVAIYNYVNGKLSIPTVAGSNTQIQINDSGDLGASANLTFNSTSNTLATTTISCSANISASAFIGDGSQLQNVGGQNAYNSFTANYTVASNHDLMGIVTTGSAITASLPAASTLSAGRRFTFKDVSGSCSGSNHIVISASAYTSAGNRIDGQGVVKIQAGFGAITIASDGVASYFIVSTS